MCVHRVTPQAIDVSLHTVHRRPGARQRVRRAAGAITDKLQSTDMSEPRRVAARVVDEGESRPPTQTGGVTRHPYLVPLFGSGVAGVSSNTDTPQWRDSSWHVPAENDSGSVSSG